jgi:hypothetical protein
VQTLEHQQYLILRDGAVTIEADRHGEKVLHLADGSYLKLYRRKRFLSSAAWYPYAERFADNARTLARLGIPCPEVIAVFRLPRIERDAVHYRPLAGTTLRQLIRDGVDATRATALKERFGAFIALLHHSGVYFRSLHLGNVVLTSDDAFGLIDLADMKVTEGPLGAVRRRRNFRHLFRYRDDQKWLLSDAGDALVQGYVRREPGVFSAQALYACMPRT